MDQAITQILLQVTGAHQILRSERVQELWSGYGAIHRYYLEGGEVPQVIVKRVQAPRSNTHPRGWNTDLSHQRKLKSYAVETAWYRDWAQHCNERCRVPHVFAVRSVDSGILLILEDLDIAGFDQRCTKINFKQIEACLSWLAHFHATFLGAKPKHLWEQGTYWHLATRPDELNVLRQEDPTLHQVAGLIDQKLRECRHQTFVHGDAKLANFCFTPDGLGVAAVDFQYVGRGCGMQDLAYFIGSCLDETACEQHEAELLDTYFAQLHIAINHSQSRVDPAALEVEWRALYPYAWTDFHRFLKGWSPGHWKINTYSEKQAQKVIQALQKS